MIDAQRRAGWGGCHDHGDDLVLAGRHLGAGAGHHGRRRAAGGGGRWAADDGHGHETWGEVVAAYVRPAPGGPAPSAEELRAYCREYLASYKTPRHWVFVDTFPMTPSGKIQKYKLRESFTSSSGS
jgi:acyl-CoA synthetase (AMP-forming)/AMP-acid ligase II